LERCGFTVQQLRDCGSDVIRGDNQSPVEMDIALSHASDRVTKQTSDCQFRKAEVTGNARESMPEGMRSDIIEFCFRAHAVEDTDNSDEVAVAQISRVDKRRIVASRRGLYAVHCRFPEHTDLRTAFGVWEVDAVLLRPNPTPLESQRFHPPKPRQQHKADSRQSLRMLSLRSGLAHYLSKVTDFVVAQSALSSFAGELPNTLRGVPCNDLQASRMAEQAPQGSNRTACDTCTAGRSPTAALPPTS
jgi:hypothetical protein